ncbi:MAG TPA: SDR family NAD(P)-dependent oxidoreductase [Rhodocyclaceae bacterium]|nr:SDR family NAD(P)-dependent oxidoreductase [Rhodocyclaceae bacterium]
MDRSQVAMIVGAGPGLGCALAQRFARAEMNVAMAARHADRLETLAIECSGIGHYGRAYECDASVESSVDALFRNVVAELGPPDVVIYNAGDFVEGSILDTTVEAFESAWRTGCLGGFVVGRAAARAMAQRIDEGGPAGTILFTGATASLRGSARFHSFAVAKFGLRALAQSMARELHPRGIHVAHVIIDGHIRPPEVVEAVGAAAREDQLDPAAIAEAYFQLWRQPRSAWTHELDLRPWVEKF